MKVSITSHAGLGNLAAESDAGVGALLPQAGVESVAMNVRINVKSINDRDYASEAWVEVQELIGKVGAVVLEVRETTYRKIG